MKLNRYGPFPHSTPASHTVKEVEDSLFADLLFSIVEIVERGYENKNRRGIELLATSTRE